MEGAGEGGKGRHQLANKTIKCMRAFPSRKRGETIFHYDKTVVSWTHWLLPLLSVTFQSPS